MKQSKQSQLIHIWEDYEFYLSIPKTFTGSNKPYVYFYYLDPKTNKSTRIRKYIGKNDGNIKLIRDEAKKLILEGRAKAMWLFLFNLVIKQGEFNRIEPYNWNEYF
nr:hypothetical protein [Pedobacter kyonggii]